MEDILKEIEHYADKAHGNQMRKYSPERYIVHPVRVMKICRQYDDRLPVLAAALLHDVLEDTAVNEKQIASFLKMLLSDEDVSETLLFVKELTDVYVKEDYPQWNRKKRKRHELERIKLTSPESQTIKYADIIDNCREIVANDPDFAPLFLKECLAVLREADKGNPELYKIAVETVEKELENTYPD